MSKDAQNHNLGSMSYAGLGRQACTYSAVDCQVFSKDCQVFTK